MSNKGRHFHPQALSTSEVEALMAACDPATPTGKRNKALIVVLWRGALRCNEALALKPSDLGQVEIEPRWWPVVDAWLAEREFFNLPRWTPVFCTMAGCPLQDRYVRQMIASRGTKAKLRKRASAKGLRYSRELEHLRDAYRRSKAG